MVRHKNQTYEGQHQAIILKEKWYAVQNLLASQSATPRGAKKSSDQNLFKGKIFDIDGVPYSPVFTNKKGKRYRYYLNQNISQLRNHPKEIIARLPALEIESFAAKAIRSIFFDKAKTANVLNLHGEIDHNILDHVVRRNNNIDVKPIIAGAIQRIIVDVKTLTIKIDVGILRKLISEDLKVYVPNVQSSEVFSLEIPFETRRSRNSAWRIEPQSQKPDIFDLPPHELRNLVRGVIWREEYFRGADITKIAQREGLDQSHIHRMIRRSLEIA